MSLAFDLAIKHVLRKRVRTILAVTGITIGVILYMSWSASLGVSRSRQLNPDFLCTGLPASNPYEAYDYLDDNTISGIQESSQGIGVSFSVLQRNLIRRSHKYADYMFSMLGLSEQFIEERLSQHLIEGKIPRNSSNEVLVGYVAAKSGVGGLFNKTIDVGQKIELPFQMKDGNIVQVEFVVVGLLDPNVEFFSPNILLPLTTFQRTLNINGVNANYVYLKDPNFRDTFIQKFNVVPHQNINIKNLGFSAAEAQTLRTYSVITLIICIISGLRSTIGNVSESLRDIGILKALGTGGFMISLMFFIESFIVSIIGGLIGVSVGFIYIQYLNSQIASSIGFSYAFVNVQPWNYLEISLILVATSLVNALVTILTFIRLFPARVGVK